MKNNVQLGAFGEGAAAEYLLSLGYTVKERNFRTQAGEIDIIALDGDRTVFVEVKTRTQGSESRYGRPASAVNYRKQKSFVFAVKAYQGLHPEALKCRIDVIEVFVLNGSTELKHIKSAFGDVK